MRKRIVPVLIWQFIFAGYREIDAMLLPDWRREIDNRSGKRQEHERERC